MVPAGILSAAQNRAAVMEELRRLLPGGRADSHQALPFGLAALDCHLPDGGLTCGALHEVVPAAEGAVPAAFGFIAAILARLFSPLPPPERGSTSEARRVGVGSKLLVILPAYGLRPYRACGRLHGHGLRALGFDPARLTLVETATRKDTLWAMAEALHAGAPAAIAGAIDKLDLKSSQRLQLAATDAGLPLLLLRPAPTLEASAAATRWRIGAAQAARDRFGLIVRPRWHLQLERCRNGRPGEWVVEYDHVAHRFSMAAALAGPAVLRNAGEKPDAAARCA